MNDSVVAIVSAFFIIGISVGIITVIALSVLRARRPFDRGDLGDRPVYGPGGTSGQPPNPGWQDGAPGWQDGAPGWQDGAPGWQDGAPADKKAHWPDETDNDFSR